MCEVTVNRRQAAVGYAEIHRDRPRCRAGKAPAARDGSRVPFRSWQASSCIVTNELPITAWIRPLRPHGRADGHDVGCLRLGIGADTAHPGRARRRRAGPALACCGGSASDRALRERRGAPAGEADARAGGTRTLGEPATGRRPAVARTGQHLGREKKFGLSSIRGWLERPRLRPQGRQRRRTP